MERRTYEQATKELLYKVNGNVKAIMNILKQQTDDDALNSTQAKSHIDDIIKCIESLSKVYAVTDKGFDKTPPQVELNLSNDYPFNPEDRSKNPNKINLDPKSLLLKVREYK